MAIDPTIALHVGQGITPLQDLTTVQMGRQNLANAMMQGQLLQSNVEKAQAEAEANRQFQETYGMSPAMASAQQKIQLGNLEIVRAQNEAAQNRLNAAEKLNDYQLSAFQAAKGALEKNPENAADIHAKLLGTLKTNAQNITPWVDTSKTDKDPSSFMTTPVPFNPQDPNAPKTWDVAAQKAWLDSKIANVPLTKQQIETRRLDIQELQAGRGRGAIGQDLETYNEGLKSQGLAPVSATDSGFLDWRSKTLAGPRVIVQAGGAAGTSANAPAKIDYTKPLTNAAAEGLARDYADGKSQQNITSRTPQWIVDARERGREIYKALNNGDDTGYGTNAGVVKKARESWAPGQSQRNIANSLDVAIGHLATRDEYINALKNNDNKTINAIANKLKTEFGLSAAPNNLAAINELVAPEIARVVKGGAPTIEDVQGVKSTMGTDYASEIQKQAGQVFRGAMGKRLEVLDNNYQAAYKGKSVSDILTPQAKKFYQSYFGRGTGNISNTPKQNYEGEVSPTGAYVFRGGSWVPNK